MRVSVWSFVFALVVALVGCAGSPGHGADPVATALPVPAKLPAAASKAAAVTPAQPVPAASAPAPAPAPGIVETLYGDAIHSVRFIRPTLLRKAPDATADKVGIIGKDARATLL